MFRCTRSRRSAILLAALWIIATVAWASEPWTWTGVGRIVAVGDVHGQYDKLEQILRGTDLIDNEGAWIGGDSHLVLVGDLTDRGPADRKILDLARRLQSEAEAAGGRVHVLLGNHEIMNLTRDFRYVSKESFAEFAAEETKKDRNEGLAAFRRGSSTFEFSLRAFNEKYPRGYFARLRMLSPDGEYGRWLMEQPAVVSVDGYLFVHGGLREEVAKLGLEGINRQVHQDILDFVRLSKELERGMNEPPTFGAFHREAKRLAGAGSGPSADARTRAAAQLLEIFESSLAFSPAGPLWYRGNSLENEYLERVEVDGVLDALDARGIVVAHTPTRSGQITNRFAGKLYRTDSGMGYGGEPFALILEDDWIQLFDVADAQTRTPLSDPPEGEKWKGGQEELSDEILEDFLTNGKIAKGRDVLWGDRRFQLLELEHNGLKARAVRQFVSESGGDNPRRFQHEVAAYWLDRRLGLGKVPVTVLRTVDGASGSLQIAPESALDLVYIREYERWSLLDGLDKQLAEAAVLVALIANRDRLDEGKMVLPRTRAILLADSSKGFPLSTEVADILEDVEEGVPDIPCGPMSAPLEESMRSLTRSEVQAGIGHLISEDQIRALLVRRDKLLEQCGSQIQPANR